MSEELPEPRESVFDAIKVGDLLRISDKKSDYLEILEAPDAKCTPEYINNYPGLAVFVLRKGFRELVKSTPQQRHRFFYVNGLLCEEDGNLRLCWVRLNKFYCEDLCSQFKNLVIL